MTDLSANTGARVLRGAAAEGASRHDWDGLTKPVPETETMGERVSKMLKDAEAAGVAGTRDPIAALTEDRGKDYGHPLDHFTAESQLYAILRAYRVQALREGKGRLDPALEHCFDHAARWILDKLVRACKSPLKQDNWDDIAGYARTFLMSVREHGRRKLESGQ